MTARALKLVEAEPPTDITLAEIVPELIAAEREVARLRRLMDAERIKLARSRGVSFIREERVRAEFGR